MLLQLFSGFLTHSFQVGTIPSRTHCSSIIVIKDLISFLELNLGAIARYDYGATRSSAQ